MYYVVVACKGYLEGDDSRIVAIFDSYKKAKKAADKFDLWEWEKMGRMKKEELKQYQPVYYDVVLWYMNYVPGKEELGYV